MTVWLWLREFALRLWNHPYFLRWVFFIIFVGPIVVLAVILLKPKHKISH